MRSRPANPLAHVRDTCRTHEGPGEHAMTCANAEVEHFTLREIPMHHLTIVVSSAASGQRR